MMGTSDPNSEEEKYERTIGKYWEVRRFGGEEGGGKSEEEEEEGENVFLSVQLKDTPGFNCSEEEEEEENSNTIYSSNHSLLVSEKNQSNSVIFVVDITNEKVFFREMERLQISIEHFYSFFPLLSK